MNYPETIWLAIGFIGQTLFASRFLVQWLKSEKERKSVIPIQFWYMSILGGIVLFLYALYKKDPVFIVGQFAGLFIYCRNLYLIYAEEKPR